LGPASPNYDLKDAQTQMAIAESAVCMKALYEIHGAGLVEYLGNTYLPSLSISSNIGAEYCEALAKKEIKGIGHFHSSANMAFDLLSFRRRQFLIRL
jgi:hypothetical protein